MKIDNDIKLDFEDVLIKPKRSTLESRKHVRLSRTFKVKSGRTFSAIPIINANMDTVGTIAISEKMNEEGCMSSLHKFYSNNDIGNHLINDDYENTFYTIGGNKEDFNKLTDYVIKYKAPANVNVDVANGYHEKFLDFVKMVRDLCGNDTFLMAGNVCTPEMVQELIIRCGVDCVKVGIGPGKACSTRMVTGVGYPQLSAIAECADVAHGLGGYICADGGIKSSGDVAKALGAGADIVMIGGLFAGADECDGKWSYGKRTLSYRGMSSKEAMDEHGGWSNYKAAEGVVIEVPYKGHIKDIIMEILGGLRSACTYIGATEIKDFAKCCTFIRCNRIK